jgi:hypothetical protein
MKVLYVTEYSNNGDVQRETAMEPAARVQKVRFESLSDPLHHDTRMVVLFAADTCEVAFVVDGRDTVWFPVAKEWETSRIVHMHTGMRVAVRSR